MYSAYDILCRVPSAYLPKTFWFAPQTLPDEVLAKLRRANARYPLLAKPDRSFRVRTTRIFYSEAELVRFWQKYAAGSDWLIQEWCTYPMKLQVTYYRHPLTQQQSITSIVLKNYLYLEGDGVHTLAKLVERHAQARCYADVLSRQYAGLWQTILPKGEKRRLLCHTKHYYTGSDKQDSWVQHTLTLIGRIAQSIGNFYIGRFDIMSTSLDDLCSGKNIRIIALWGIDALPIADNALSWQAYKVLLKHWRAVYHISRANRWQGAHPASLPMLFRALGLRNKQK